MSGDYARPSMSSEQRWINYDSYRTDSKVYLLIFFVVDSFVKKKLGIEFMCGLMLILSL